MGGPVRLSLGADVLRRNAHMATAMAALAAIPATIIVLLLLGTFWISFQKSILET